MCLSAVDCQAIFEILTDTKTGLPAGSRLTGERGRDAPGGDEPICWKGGTDSTKAVVRRIDRLEDQFGSGEIGRLSGANFLSCPHRLV
jgi:hypothetical protein